MADGQTENVSITLRDRYGNNIIPASGLGRGINVRYTTDNRMYLDQYNRSGGSSVFLTEANDVDTPANYSARFPIGLARTTAFT